MNSIYRRPLVVYLLLGALALWGIISGLQLSISLFPMASQPTIAVNVNYGSYSPKQFFDSIGIRLEPALQSVEANGIPVALSTARYGGDNAFYRLQFEWGADPQEAVRMVEAKLAAILSGEEESIRRSTSVNSWRENQGFFAVSFFSPLRSLDELHQVLEPLLIPQMSSIKEAEGVELYNPAKKEITVRLLPERLAARRISTTQIERAIKDSIVSLNGGSLQVGDKDFQIQLPKQAADAERLANIQVSLPNTPTVLLKDVASLSVGVAADSQQRFRTSGVESLILFASPKEGANIKLMSDQILAAMQKVEPQFPKDVQYKILVNPSEFINRSISSVLREVGIAAFLAVTVLFFFIGSFRNVATAAIEIPLSLLIAFVLMRLTGMNLNLISLGGLALSAGMNVDASVVVLENIFKHFHGKPKGLSYEDKARIIGEAVNEVKFPIIASTIASLVVFIPLIFTRGLTNSLLGDLAKAVVFSHGLSAVVALVLVPTIRLHLFASGELKHSESYFEPFLVKIEKSYRNALDYFLRSARMQWGVMAVVIALLVISLVFVAPKLKNEIMGKPETDWVIMGVRSPLITTAKQNDAEVSELEQDLLQRYSSEVQYTFSRVQGTNSAWVMLRLKDKGRTEELRTKIEEFYKNTPTKSYWVDLWNPSELNIPDPPQLELEISGGTPASRLRVAQDLKDKLNEEDVYDNLSSSTPTSTQKALRLVPAASVGSEPALLSRYEISHILRLATGGLYVDSIQDDRKSLPIYLRFGEEWRASIENLSAIPIGGHGKLLPLGALGRFDIVEREPSIYRENGNALNILTGSLKKVNLPKQKERKIKAQEIVKNYRNQMQAKPEPDRKENPVLIERVADKELQEALAQLKTAILISIVLIFLTMVLQLGDIVHSLLVLVAIPLGVIGVIGSLAIFQSSLSLNAGLGIILLNGIAVANSIILVDFIRKKFLSGIPPLEATVSASTHRLRPILMTTLTTGLGMFPIALGLGEGGKTLQPLGIAVCGGLWFSTLLTLFLVPCLQYRYLSWKSRQSRKKASSYTSAAATRAKQLMLVLFVAFTSNAVTAAPKNFLDDLDHAKSLSTGLLSERARLAATASRSLSKGFFWSPTLSASVGDSKYSANGVKSNGTSYWSADASWNLFRGGSDLYQKWSADAATSAQEFATIAESLKTEKNAASIIFKSLFLMDAEKAQQEQLHLKEEALRIAKSRYEQGKVSLQEMTKIEVDLAQQRNRARLAAVESAANEVEIKTIFRRPVTTTAWPFNANQIVLLADPETLSPQTQSLQLLAKSNEYNWKSARSLHLPSVDLNFQYKESPWRERTDRFWSGTLLLTLPIWNHWETAATAEQNYASFVSADQSSQEAELKNRAELDFLRKKIELSRRSLNEAEKNMTRSEKLYQDMLLSFRLGRLSANDLFQEQNRLIESQLDLSQSRLSFHNTAMDVCALGGTTAADCLQ